MQTCYDCAWLSGYACKQNTGSISRPEAEFIYILKVCTKLAKHPNKPNDCKYFKQKDKPKE